MADFHETRFPTDISRGSASVLGRRTDIITLRSGFEERNSVWADSRREYDAGMGLRNINDLYEVIEFWEARLGSLYGFRWKDWADWRSGAPNRDITRTDQAIGTGNGSQTKFQLVKAYTSGPTTYTRNVTKPVEDSTIIDVNGVLVDPADYSIDTTTGIVTFDTAPTSGHVISAGFEFDVPVRFMADKINISVQNFNAGEIPQIDLIEVKTTLGTLDS